MKRALQQAIVFFGILLLVTLVRLPYGSYRESMLSWAREAASPQGISVDFADITLAPPFTMLLDKLNLLIPVDRFPFPVNVERASLSLRPLSLFRLRASGSGEINFYQGVIDYDFYRPLFGKSVEASGTFTNISLAAHPVLGSFGLSGTLEGKFFDRLVEDDHGLYSPESGDLSLALRNGGFQGGIKIMQLVPVPQVQNISMVAQLKYDATTIVLPALTFDSSLGSFTGKGRLRRRADTFLGEGKIEGTLHLSDQGKTLYGGYLALAARSAIDKPATDWDVLITFDALGRPLATVQPHGA